MGGDYNEKEKKHCGGCLSRTGMHRGVYNDLPSFMDVFQLL